MVRRGRKNYWNSVEAEKAVEAYVNSYWKDHFRSPTYREIMVGIEAKSTSCIARAVGNLERRGKIIDRNSSGGIGILSVRQIIPVWVIKAIKAYSEAGEIVRKTK